MTTATEVPTARIVIVDDHPLVRDGLRARIESQPGWSVVGEAEGSTEALRLVRELSPDLVIVDLSLKSGNGIELLKQLSNFPQPPLMLVCSMQEENLYAQRALHAGARGYLHKQQASESLVAAIQRVLEGKIYVSDAMSDQMMGLLIADPQKALQNPVSQLTDRELEVFQAIGQGMSIHQISELLHLSPKTIETYRDRTKRKLNVKTSAELIRYAVKWVTEHGEG